MPSTELEVRIEGEPGAVPARAFLDVLRTTLEILDQLDRAERSGAVPAGGWLISALRSSSAVVALRRPEAPDPQAAHRLVHGVRQLAQQQELPPHFSPTTATALIRIGRWTHQPGVSGVTFTVPAGPGRSADSESVSAAAVSNARSAIEGSDQALGSVTGLLDGINLRRGRGASACTTKPRGALSAAGSPRHSSRQSGTLSGTGSERPAPSPGTGGGRCWTCSSSPWNAFPTRWPCPRSTSSPALLPGTPGICRPRSSCGRLVVPDYQRIYFDADVYLALIKGEEGRVDIARGLLRRGQDRRFVVVASTLIYAEVCGHGDVRAAVDAAAVDQKISTFFEHGSFIRCGGLTSLSPRCPPAVPRTAIARRGCDPSGVRHPWSLRRAHDLEQERLQHRDDRWWGGTPGAVPVRPGHGGGRAPPVGGPRN
jgi:hypothetical protein